MNDEIIMHFTVLKFVLQLYIPQASEGNNIKVVDLTVLLPIYASIFFMNGWKNKKMITHL